jgi:V8-like Glu-specific endopeptidase
MKKISLLLLLLRILASSTMELHSVKIRQNNEDDEGTFSERPSRTLRGDRTLSKRVVGGETASPGRFPYFSFLSIKASSGRYQCGGTLIYPDVVMSAAHCYQDFIEGGDKILGIRVWVNLTTTEYRTGYEYGRNVIEALVHPNYDSDRTRQDIVLFKLNETVPQVPTPLLSTPGADPLPGADVVALGHGLLEEGGEVSMDLQEVELNVIGYDNCNDENSYKGNIQEDTMICAGVDGGGKDTCAGDSGGPLFVKGQSPQEDMVFGITSWGVGCARAEKYGIYTKVSAFDDFVGEGICVLSSDSPPYCHTVPPSAISFPIFPPSSAPNTPEPSTDTPYFQPSMNPSQFIEVTQSPIVPTPAPSPQPVTSTPSLHPSVSFAPSEVPTQQLNPPVSPVDSCVEIGDECEISADCCSERCVDTNNAFMGKRCFGPRGAVKQSTQRYGSSQGGSGGSVTASTTWLLRQPPN